MKNSFFKYSTITFLVLACILCSCKGKERAEYNDIGQIDLESLACDSMKDMAEAFPRIEKYHDYKLTQVHCSSEQRIFNLIYFTKDNLSNMIINVYDVRLPKNDIFLLDTKQRFDLAKLGQFKNKKISTIIGEYGSISNIYPENKEQNYVISFKCILKKNYVFDVLISQNKSDVNFENFFKDYVSRIDASKLK